jgi:FxLD family lantipeptide
VTPQNAPAPVVDPESVLDLDEFDLDVTVVESGQLVEELIRMTDDGCGTTCQSACPNTCPGD